MFEVFGDVTAAFARRAALGNFHRWAMIGWVSRFARFETGASFKGHLKCKNTTGKEHSSITFN
jgi:hypothetical protein